MAITSDDITQIIKSAIDEFDAGLETRSVGLALERLLKREAGTRQISELLTPREIEIVRMVVGGLRNKEIADRLYISEGTIKVHLHNIYEKLKVNSRLQLARYARDKGLA